MIFFKTPWATNGSKTAIPESTQVDGSVSQDEGWGPDYEEEIGTDPDAKPIGRNTMNWLLAQITEAIQQYQTHGFYDFITTLINGGTPYEYAKAAVVRFDDGSGFANYESLVDNNDSDPTDTTKWRRLAAPATIPTGAGMDFWGTSAPDGWVMADGRTIGNAASGATNRANADTEALFTLLWNSTANATLPIQDSSGNPVARGLSAGLDYAANRRFPLPDLRGRVVAGKDDMGGTDANRLTDTLSGGVNGNILAASGGADGHTLTVAQLAAHSHSLRGEGGSSGPQNAVSFDSPNNQSRANLVNSAGGDQAHNNVQPTIVSNKIIKL